MFSSIWLHWPCRVARYEEFCSSICYCNVFIKITCEILFRFLSLKCFVALDQQNLMNTCSACTFQFLQEKYVRLRSEGRRLSTVDSSPSKSLKRLSSCHKDKIVYTLKRKTIR